MENMKFLIIIATFIVACESGCPSMCNCTESAVLCMEKNLESVPSFESLVNDPLIIDLSGNKINMIDNDDFSFDKSDRVKEIYLNNTELLDLDSEAFDELESLQELYLGDNLLNSIPEHLIEDLPNMILLDISNNHFSGGLPKFISKSLEVLAVANAKVTSLPMDSLKYLPNLKMLLLQQNNIKSINPAVFENVNKNSFFVRLSYNMCDCSCENLQLFEYLAGREFIDTSDPYQCLTNSGIYVNIYQDGNLEDLKSKCYNNSQVVRDLPASKENRFVMKAEGQLKEEEEDVGDADKPYSLVKEVNDTLQDQLGSEFTIQNSEILDNYIDEGEYADILEREVGVSEDRNTETMNEEKSVVALDLSIGSFIAIFGSFIIGIIFGFCLNQFITMLRYRNLESSDSRTKLILL